jgi:glyoxylase-like metal-dependent hydrolase (beta-lactamase superfamily II)
MPSKSPLAIPVLALEDTYMYVALKAQKGRQLTSADIAERSQVDLNVIETILAGKYDKSPIHNDALEKIAFILGLHGPSLVALANKSYAPKPISPINGFGMFTTPFGEWMTVNAYVINDPTSKQAASFDTGSSCAPMLSHVNEHQLNLSRLFITHTHMDHLADMDALQAKTDSIGYGPAIENPLGLKPIREGDAFILGDSVRITVLGTSGHTPGGLSYFITGLSKPFVITGDALFAGSMGGAAMAYETALRNNREKILSLPPETVICPGHGPLTTVAEERANNPFFPELK